LAGFKEGEIWHTLPGIDKPPTQACTYREFAEKNAVKPYVMSPHSRVMMSFEECLGRWPAAERSDAPELCSLGLRKLSH
jgi:hypothetical protein